MLLTTAITEKMPQPHSTAGWENQLSKVCTVLASQLVKTSAMRQWATAGALLLLCCQSSGPRSLRDSEGRTFSATCKDGAPCRFEQKSGPRRAEKPAQSLLVGSRLVGICDVKDSEAP